MVDVSAKIEQARLHVEAGRAEQARLLLERALRQTPGHADLCNAMSMVLQSMGKHDQALYFSQRAAQGRPMEPGFLLNLGNVYGVLARFKEAEDAYGKCLAINPHIPDARLGLSHILRQTYRYAAATEQLELALKDSPNDPELIGALSQLMLKQARVEDAVALAQRGLQLAPGHLNNAAALALSVNYMPGVTPEGALGAQRLLGEAYSRSAPKRWTQHANTPEPERKLRIGLLSGDFRQHAVMFFLEPFMEHLDRSAFELACYATGPGDDVTTRLKSYAAVWRDLHTAAPAAIADAIHTDRVDILIELSGHASGHNMPAVAMRPAPIQVNFLGYPCSTGMPEIDYRIVDSLTDPSAAPGWPGADAFASERLLRIDPSFLCFRPGVPPPPTPPTPGDRHGIVFGSFNSAIKINRGVIHAWARLLRETRDSTLYLKALEFQDGTLEVAFKSQFAAEGVAPERIRCAKLTRTYQDHLACYAEVDIALDTFPYTGTTTTFESLYMSVPVITLEGARHVERVSSAILTNAGLSDLIAHNQDQYIQLARDLAADAGRRASLRETIRPRLLASPLCDGPAFAARLGNALRGVWREWCARAR